MLFTWSFPRGFLIITLCAFLCREYIINRSVEYLHALATCDFSSSVKITNNFRRESVHTNRRDAITIESAILLYKIKRNIFQCFCLYFFLLPAPKWRFTTTLLSLMGIPQTRLFMWHKNVLMQQLVYQVQFLLIRK